MAKSLTKKPHGKRKRTGAPEVRPATDIAKKQEVKITAAKGRPMLTWVGKRPLRHVVAFPAQHVETFDPSGDANKRGGEIWNDWPEAYPRAGLLFHGDNKEVLAHLLANGFRGKINLIYIDPPFDSGADYVRKVSLRGAKGTAKLDGESYTLGEQLQYTDIWANDNYLQFMYERLLLLKELMAENGSIYVHCDSRRSHQLRLLLDEIFGAERFRSEVVWKRADAHSSADRYGPIHDILLYYSIGDQLIWNPIRTGVSQGTADTWYTNEEIAETDVVNRLGQPIPAATVRRYNKADLSAPGDRRGTKAHYEWHGHFPPPGRHWSVRIEEMRRLEAEGRLVYSATGKVYEKRYLDETQGAPLQSLWLDISQIRGMQQTDRTDTYPTEKPEGLLDRVIRASSDPGDLVLDCFIGSGTTAAVAQKLGRRWIGCDVNKGAIQTTSKRLQVIIQEQIEATRQQPLTLALSPQGRGDGGEVQSAQLSFAVYRVNDYDLAIQHEEAVNLACEHIGVTRIRTDRYFDGTLGKKLVKVIPFNHPLTLLDLDELKRELGARPEEDRAIVLVCLGKEPAADAWIEDWNRLRRGKTAVNRVEVIELRTDPKYGKLFQHQPARARVKWKRKNDTIIVEIKDFISPSIIERLQEQAGLLKPKIDDWRAMVDCVLIDPNYDGKVFRIGLSDVPERKTDLVVGRYEIPADLGTRTVAVKIIDMLGEEVLITQPVKASG